MFNTGTYYEKRLRLSLTTMLLEISQTQRVRHFRTAAVSNSTYSKTKVRVRRLMLIGNK